MYAIHTMQCNNWRHSELHLTSTLHSYFLYCCRVINGETWCSLKMCCVSWQSWRVSWTKNTELSTSFLYDMHRRLLARRVCDSVPYLQTSDWADAIWSEWSSHWLPYSSHLCSQLSQQNRRITWWMWMGYRALTLIITASVDTDETFVCRKAPQVIWVDQVTMRCPDSWLTSTSLRWMADDVAISTVCSTVNC